jgi:hypothetical protein
MRQLAAEFLPFQMPGGQTHGLVTHGSPVVKGDVAEKVVNDTV